MDALYIPSIRGDQERLFEAEYCLRAHSLGLVQVRKLTPSLCIGWNGPHQFCQSGYGVGGSGH